MGVFALFANRIDIGGPPRQHRSIVPRRPIILSRYFAGVSPGPSPVAMGVLS